MLDFFHRFSDFQLDIVGIVAILGEGSTQRNAHAASLSWFHVLPRLYPAPQALLQHHQEKKLPTESGIVVGALSGRIRNELNFFTQLMHKDDLPEYAVEVVEVRRKIHDDLIDPNTGEERKGPPAFWVKTHGHLAGLAVLGCVMSCTLLGLAVWQQDGPALLATIFLSITSSFVGLASWAILDNAEEVPNKDREGKVPLGDVVIFYPRTGAFRIVRCTDAVSRLYFRVEQCIHYYDDNRYRVMALFSTILLMAGLIFIGNAQANMQAAFAMSYILLNALYWTSSALDPRVHVWANDFDTKEVGFTKKMIPTANGRIVPMQSELSPVISGMDANVESGAEISNRSYEYYWNRQWTKREFNRVPTVSVIVRPGEHLPPVENNRAPTFRQFVTGEKTKDQKSWPRMLDTNRTAEMQRNGVVSAKSHKEHPKRSLTSALWTAIALTGSAGWARASNIAPNNLVWDKWLEEAESVAAARWSRSLSCFVPPCTLWTDSTGKNWVALPNWHYQERLSSLFADHCAHTTARWESPQAISDMESKLKRLHTKLRAVFYLKVMVRFWQMRRRRRLMVAALVNV